MSVRPAAEMPTMCTEAITGVERRATCAGCTAAPRCTQPMQPYIGSACLEQVCARCRETHSKGCKGKVQADVEWFDVKRTVTSRDIELLFPQFRHGASFRFIMHVPASGEYKLPTALKSQMGVHTFVTFGDDDGGAMGVVACGNVECEVEAMQTWRWKMMHGDARRIFLSSTAEFNTTTVQRTDDNREDFSGDELEALSRLSGADRHGAAHGPLKLREVLRALDVEGFEALERDVKCEMHAGDTHLHRMARVAAYITGSMIVVATAIGISIFDMRGLLSGASLPDVLLAVYQCETASDSARAHTAYEFVGMLRAAATSC